MGTVNTPQLLKLSGVGDRLELEAWVIKLEKHLPAVGKNMSDVRFSRNITAFF